MNLSKIKFNLTNIPIAFCPSCGKKLKIIETDYLESETICNNCKLKWLIIWDIDDNDNYGVKGFQCNNEDR